MTALVKYEAARAALQAAHKVDEVKDIRDKAQAMALYAKQAQDTELVAWATEIKVRAERRAGEMLAAMKVNGARHDAADNLKEGPKSHDTTSGPTLDSIGVSKDQSSRWQKLAAIPEDRFEKAVAEAKGTDGEVTTASLLRAMKPKAKPRPAAPAPTEKPQRADTEKLTVRISVLETQLAETKESLGEMADLAKSAKAFEEKAEFKEMQVLRIELRSCKRRRDELMAENASQKKFIAHLQKKAGKK